MVPALFGKTHRKRKIDLGPLKHSLQRTHVRWSRHVIDEGDHLPVSLERDYTGGSVFPVPHHGDDGIRVTLLGPDAQEEEERGISCINVRIDSLRDCRECVYR